LSYLIRDIQQLGSWKSVFDIAASLGAGSSGIHGSISGRDKILLFFKASKTISGIHKKSYSMGTGDKAIGI
jgi:hypothetical protein